MSIERLEVDVAEKRRCYDPRDPEQSLADPGTWKETDNPALIVAREQLSVSERIGGELMPDWGRVAAWADYCDEPIPLLQKEG